MKAAQSLIAKLLAKMERSQAVCFPPVLNAATMAYGFGPAPRTRYKCDCLEYFIWSSQPYDEAPQSFKQLTYLCLAVALGSAPKIPALLLTAVSHPV